MLSQQKSEQIFLPLQPPESLKLEVCPGSLSSNGDEPSSPPAAGGHIAAPLFPSLSLFLSLFSIVEPPCVRWEEQGSCYVSDEKLTISPSLRVRINPLKTSQILAPRSATLGLTTGGNYTFCFLFSPDRQRRRPGREHTHARTNTHALVRRIPCNPCSATIAARTSDDTL